MPVRVHVVQLRAADLSNKCFGIGMGWAHHYRPRQTPGVCEELGLGGKHAAAARQLYAFHNKHHVRGALQELAVERKRRRVRRVHVTQVFGESCHDATENAFLCSSCVL